MYPVVMDEKSDNNRVSGLDGVAQSVAQAESTQMQYTELRGRIYWFRRRAPLPLLPGMRCVLGDTETVVGKNGYVRVSLDTTDRREAARLARKYAHYLDLAAERIGKIKRPHSSEDVPAVDSDTLTPEEIRHAADTMLSILLAADEDTLVASAQDLLDGEDASEVRQPDRFEWSMANLPENSLEGQIELLKKFRNVFSFYLHITAGKTIQKITTDLLPFADAFRRYVGALEKRKAAEIVPTPPIPTPVAIWSWDQAFDYYFQQRKVSDETKSTYRLAWSSLAASAKGHPVTLTTEAVVAWRDELLNGVGHKHPKTVQDRLTAAKAIWRESRVNAKMPRTTPDPFEGLRVWIDPNEGSSREEYSVKELKTLFDAPPVQTARAVSAQSGYWLPLLALYHGARLEEVAGLEVIDMDDWNDGLALHIRENTIRPRLKHRKKSERRIPVHPKLIELGFKDYVNAARKAGIQALFPSFASGATFGEAYVEHVKELLQPAEGRLVGMHCLRHNWETARRTATLDPSASNYITGRRIDPGSAAVYGNPASLETLNKELSKIDYGLKHAPAPAVTAEDLKAQDERRKRAKRSKAKSTAK
jgi:integrase